jgi:hypothetical protein
MLRSVNIEVKLSLCFLHGAMKAYWGVDVYFRLFLASALDGGEWSASHSGHFTSRERVPGTHRIGVWVSPRVGLEAVVKRKIPSLCWDSNPQESYKAPHCAFFCSLPPTSSVLGPNILLSTFFQTPSILV